MAMSIEDVHHTLIQVCICGDLQTLFNLQFYNKHLTDQLINDQVAYSYKSKFGKHKPGNYLYLACEYGTHEIVEQLMKMGMRDVTAVKFGNKTSPMLIACEKGHVKCLEKMTLLGASLHAEDIELKNSCLYTSTLHNRRNVIEYIANTIPDVLQKNALGGLGQCPNSRHVALWGRLSAIIASPDENVKIGSILLYISSLMQHFDLVEYFITKGTGVNRLLSASSLYTQIYQALGAACENEDNKLSMLLLRNKAEFTTSIVNQYPEFTANLLSCLTEVREEEEEISVDWGGLGIYKLHRCWIDRTTIFTRHQLRCLDVHNNLLSDLPFDLFELLTCIEELDISCNKIKKLPIHALEKSSILKLLACKNHLEKLPIELLNNESVRYIDASSNHIAELESIAGENWKCASLVHLRLSDNLLSRMPNALHGAEDLNKLMLNANKFEVFDLTWPCPLTELDISHNQLDTFCSLAQTVWSKSLTRLNLSHNRLTSVGSSICHLLHLQHLNLSYNELPAMPSPSTWKCTRLLKLNLSHNLLTANMGPEGFVKINQSSGMKAAVCVPENLTVMTSCEFPVHLFAETLTSLDFSHNKLEVIPESVCLLKTLNELDISNNSTLKTLPPELGLLENLWNLRLSNLKINDLPIDLSKQNVTKSVLFYLKSKLRKAVPFNRMKLMVVGLQGRGKTTLVATLQGKPPPLNVMTDGIAVDGWTLTPPKKTPFFWNQWGTQEEEIVFSCWDLAGQHVYYSTHQCFLTNNTLYLAVFNTMHGHEGVQSLQSWLLNIQARAPESNVIIVGTHIDCLPETDKLEKLVELHDTIYTRYDKKGFPKIKGCTFISNLTEEGLSNLRNVVYKVAREMNVASGHGLNKGKTAPLSYKELYDSVQQESDRRRSASLPPILTTDEMLRLAQENPNNDIDTIEELIAAGKFLHENGILLHFNDQLRELNTLFFIDPSWLCDMLALVVTVRERNPYIAGGYIYKRDLIAALNNPRLPQRFIPQYLRLLERFEIALSIDEEKTLIPSMLPVEKPSFLNTAVVADSTTPEVNVERQYVWRNYYMSYIPAGFWCKLIARVIIAVKRWGVTVENRGEEFRLTYWREGIFVIYTDGYFLLHPIQQTNSLDEPVGVAISIWSKNSNFSVLGFVVDHIDTIINEWYPGLEDIDESGDPLIQKLIPCPICMSAYKHSSGEVKLDFVPDADICQQFNLNMCAMAATNHEAITCSRHPDTPVSLALVVPDFLLSDLPHEMMITGDQLLFEATDATRLGEGGAGGVYLGRYQEQNVAVKQFHSTKNTVSLQTSNSSTKEGVYTPLNTEISTYNEETKVMQAFWELRQEVALLSRLKHENIVRLIGVCKNPLCFLLELAPQGSLQGALEKHVRRGEEKTFGPILGEVLTHKIALQVAHALAYLHSSEIIYRDLKSDNILLWTLDENAPVNVKLSDYGISTFATPQGVIGEGGTPGFQAPEVRVGCAYDEKVDIFSFGIWLFELISGFRPFRTLRSVSEIKRAVQRGVRPDLAADGIDANMPYIETLMHDCWQNGAESRPSAVEVCDRLNDTSVTLLNGVVDGLEKVMCVCSFRTPDDSEVLMIWCNENERRNYMHVDMSTRVVIEQTVCAGPIVLCALQVGSLVWLGTRNHEIEVFGDVGSHGKKIMWKIPTNDDVTNILLYQSCEKERIFASLANGEIVTVERSVENREPLFKEEVLDIVSFERDKWSYLVTIDLGIKEMSAKCMVLTRNHTELWVGVGNMIVVVDPQTLTVLQHIHKVFSTSRSLICALVTDQQNVWTTCRNSALVKQWHVETRAPRHKFQCNVSARNSTMPLEPTSGRCSNLFEASADAQALSQLQNVNLSEGVKEKQDDSPERLRFGSYWAKRRERQNSVNEQEKRKLSLSKSNSLKEGIVSKGLPEKCESELMKHAPMLDKFRHNKNMSIKITRDKKNNDEQSANLRTRLVGESNETVTCLYLHENALYVGRSVGDIIVLNVDTQSDSFGRVIMQMNYCDKRPCKVTGLVQLGEHIACVVRIEPVMMSPRGGSVSSLRSTTSLSDYDEYQLLHLKAPGACSLITLNRQIFKNKNCDNFSTIIT